MDDPHGRSEWSLAGSVKRPSAGAQLPRCTCWCARRSNWTPRSTLRPASITLDYLDLYGLSPRSSACARPASQARVASPRVLKPGEERIVDFLLGCDCPILVRSAGPAAARSQERPHAALIGDFSLNAANALTAAEFLGLGLAALTPTHDLNAAQVAALAREVGGERIEAVAYQHLPVFHTEHCVFCRFLSTGTSYRDCGRPARSTGWRCATPPAARIR